MKHDDILYALTDVRGEYIEEAAPARRRPMRRGLVGLLAASLALLMMGAAAIFGGSVQDWMAHRWAFENIRPMGEGQTALVDSMSQEIGLSQTIGDVTVDVDSAIFEDQGFRILVRVRGQQFDQKRGIDFRRELMELEPDPAALLGEEVHFSGGRGWEAAGFDGDGSLLLFFQCYWDVPRRPDEPFTVRLTMSDLYYSGSGGEVAEVIQEGTWEFAFPLEVTGVPAPIALPDCTVETEEHGAVELKNLILYSTGITYEQTGEGDIFPVTIILEDGSSIAATLGTGDSQWWDVPVDPAEVKAVQIGETVIPVHGD
ncbi:MAG: hypothetical protein IJA49_07545 [Oscillospiraceae bacterium]|nr:hypothetical protein [Oscillospiraceae bacterium]